MKKKVFIILGVLVALVATYMLLFPGKNPFRSLKKLTSNSSGTITDPATAGTTPGAPNIPGQTSGFPLAQDVHTYKKSVATLQEALNYQFGSGLVVDGYFGPKTLRALKVLGYAQNDTLSWEEYAAIVDAAIQ